MKTLLYLLIGVFLPLKISAQNDFWARLSISGSVNQLGISPTEKIWIATNAGNIYHTKEVDSLWHLGAYGSFDPYSYNSGNTFERINFFSEDVLMISGFIQENGKQDFVYRSENQGKSWEKVIFGKNSWIDAAYVNNNGKAWMSGSSLLIYYTEDMGKTWSTFDKVDPNEQVRFSSIHFSNDEQTGLFGSNDNALYKTTDNCNKWEKLPTPLNQDKYKKRLKNERARIKKIRILGNNYIINQQGNIFITDSNSINWTYLPEIIDFEVTEDEKLYTINKDLSISLYNCDFTKKWQSDQVLKNKPRAIEVKNNNLFALTQDYIYKINPNDFIASQLFTDEIAIQEPYYKIVYEDEEYGFDKKDILHFNKLKNAWYRYMSVDFFIENSTIFDNKIVLTNQTLSKHYNFCPIQKSVTEFSLPRNLFSDLEIKEFHLESGSQGCFHVEHSSKLYLKKEDEFKADKKGSNPKFLPRSEHKIKTTKIKQMVNLVDESRFKKVTLEDLKITDNDIKVFKEFIDKEEQELKALVEIPFMFENLYAFPGENIDYNFYKNIADSLVTLSEEEIDKTLWQVYGSWSTTTNWKRITFVFENEQKLIIENTDDKPNYLYAPWIVDFDGLKFQTNSILFGQEIDKITNGQFFHPIIRDKNYALFKIADYLYRKKLNIQ